MVEITDKKSLEVWLKGKPQEVAVAIAARAALRVLPLIWEVKDRASALQFDLDIVLPVFRCTLTSAVAAGGSTAEVKAAATLAAYYAARAADASAYAAGASLWREIGDYASALEMSDFNVPELFACPLRENTYSIERISENWIELSRYLRNSKRPAWNFFADWYERMRGGKPMDWELLREVALIPSKDWKDLDRLDEALSEIFEEALSGVIGETNRLWSRYRRKATGTEIALIEKTQLPEAVEVDPLDELFLLLPKSIEEKSRYENAVRKVRDSLADLRGEPKFHNYSTLQTLARILDRTFDAYAGDPMRTHDDFVKSAKMIRRNCACGELPDGDDLIENLFDDLNIGAADIRASDSAVHAATLARARMTLRRMTEEEALSLAHEVALRVQQSKPELAQDLRDDLETLKGLLEDGTHPEDPEPEQAAQREGSRLAKMRKAEREAEETGETKPKKVTQLADGAVEIAEKSERSARASRLRLHGLTTSSQC